MYVDAYHARENDKIHVVERVNGKREFQEYPVNYTFYYEDPKGKFTSIYGEPCTKYSTRSFRDFKRELKAHQNKKLFESDLNVVFKCLEEHYLNKDAPDLHVAFFDIEVDFNPERGYAPPDDPFSPITAISVYCNWLDQLITLALPPQSIKGDAVYLESLREKYDNTFFFEREEDLLNTFLQLIEDADVLSGWNSEGFDIPYTVNRVTLLLGKGDTRRFCLWDRLPKVKEYEKFGSKRSTYELIGRLHLDYLELYRKYTYHEMHSYRLDAIGEYEVKETKVPYEGTLDRLYNYEFDKFIAYNRQDTMLLKKIDDKLKFIALASEVAHANSVLVPTAMGAVAVTDQAIINEIHARGFVVPARKVTGEDRHGRVWLSVSPEKVTTVAELGAEYDLHSKRYYVTKDQYKRDPDTWKPYLPNITAAGAYVATPKQGLHDWIGAVDLNSLYPSSIRALNMGPETIIGQLRPTHTEKLLQNKILNSKNQKMSFAEAWDNEFGSKEYQMVMEKSETTDILVDWEDGNTDLFTGNQIYDIVFNENRPWMISGNGTIFKYDVEGIIPGLLARWYAERVEMQGKKSAAKDNKEKEYWDKRQLVKKIGLNSLYGAILNPGSRFFDIRIGQSTTLTGRLITRHMASHVNETITGEYDHKGDAVIYGDTDSVYFSAYKTLKEDINAGNIPWSKETVLELYDQIASQVNSSFTDFMKTAFHCPPERAKVIKAGRECVASKGLYIKKKRYAILMYEYEGKRQDQDGKAGKIKAMGLDLKRADTPKIMQDFLESVLIDMLKGADAEYVKQRVREFQVEFKKRPGWEKGTPKRVNNLTKFTKLENEGKAKLPGHVRAAMNWNTLRKMYNDNYSMPITDGQKTIVCKLKSNPLGFTSCAYPIDELNLPQWYKDLPFDHDAMEAAIIDEKLNNLFGVLDWDLRNLHQADTVNKFFTFE